MKRVQKGKGRQRKPKKKTEPLAEGIIKPDGRRDWASMSDEELARYAQKYIGENGIDKRDNLRKADYGLYAVLGRRKLIELVFFPIELKKIEETVQQVLDAIRNGRGLARTDWRSMNDEQLVNIAKTMIVEEGLKTRWDLQKKRSGFYRVLKERSLLDAIGLRSKHRANRERREWASMSDEEILEYAQKTIQQHKVTKRNGLRLLDGGLYSELLRRRILGQLFPSRTRRPKRFFKDMNDDKLVEYAIAYARENGIEYKWDLGKKDPSLYQVLRSRGLVNRLSLAERAITWSSMSHDEIVGLAREFLEQNKISKRYEMERANRKLYRALERRDLLDQLFTTIESEQQKQAVQEVVEAMREFE